ncbi:MAG: type I 3-dehydroquinate dehydratase [Deltaproteobacteria bacterium]|nr:type I 3-dehydroquinate dehydratase [Deltaproteobacteria bacterium]MBW2049807.1 type I 3-dehydroquinate dehydratase [Deltaproteobacteria bacterium]MBW2111802.1 type I 3-dehydroquinate dehydratase [Deltaproteobacteria bacterium]MBW2353558.1 type I 3-dehydroquinate dehydratase [Deltaproteobacteria bacterium]HDZ89991.1 type I 3-dehydroquinate dehydratase [Deltaproteobacteria bacterium]
MICIPIMARDNDDALRKIAEAGPLADMLEIRLDAMEAFDLHELIGAAPKPVIVTYRSRREGGLGRAGYGIRVQHLMTAVHAGAAFVDVEYSLPLEHRYRILQHRGETGVIVSRHYPRGTPTEKSLKALLRDMAATGADLVKIVTMARTPRDDLRVLGLIPEADRLGIRIIAFCMGPMGRISRVATVPMGGYLTFASLENGQESAPGQFPAGTMKEIFEALSS